MPIVSPTGRRSRSTRTLFALMYGLLIVGAATMVYPFLLMISGSMKSAVDIKHFEMLPGFLRAEDWLYRKHVEALFNERLLDANMVYRADLTSFEQVHPPAAAREAYVLAWENFLREQALADYAWQSGYQQAPYSRTMPSGLRLFKKRLRQQYGRELHAVNRALETDFINWHSVNFVPFICLLRRHHPPQSKLAEALTAFKATLPLEWRYYVSPEGCYQKLFLKSQYGGDIEVYNAAHGTHFAQWSAIPLRRSYLANPTAQSKADWESFVRQTLALAWVRVAPAAQADYQAYLRAKYQQIEVLNRHYQTQYAGFEEVPLWAEPPPAGLALSDWDSFIVGWHDPQGGQFHQAPAQSLAVQSVEFMFQDYLRTKYVTLADLNQQLQTEYEDWAEVLPPQQELHWRWFRAHRRQLRWEFATRNYKTATEYIIRHGRGVLNTVIYCALAVMAALLVNPLAAYAMSRYRMPSTYKVLLVLMATMAFPAMVTQIPSFLMLRQFKLLNTFAALILPGVANGFSIFLLKGFFDSLPAELYESAQLDGAGEWVMFWQVTMSLSKPILAVIALGAFAAAYANFMFAFVVCQDERMWTLMVWLYQLQQISGQGVMYAALIIAAIPTFLIFLFCQNIIMRGIVVPAEK
ncbi:MAG: carbohydrate ABC transporter permease [Lentisphaerae bacterium]|nr:carbohydrate ABC transporter permease [Lentisphaerota bacterium]